MTYVELHAHSAYSFLDGASTPEELLAAAAVHGYPALALTDHDGLWGTMEFAQAAKGLGVKAITGAELTIKDDRAAPAHITLLVQDSRGYRNLCRLVTLAHAGTRANPREPTPPRISLDQLERHAEGLVCLSGCARDGLLARRIETGVLHQAERLAGRLVAAFGADRFRIELQRPFWRRDRARNRALAQLLADRLGVATVATGNVHAHHPERARLQDALVAVRLPPPSTRPSPSGAGTPAP